MVFKDFYIMDKYGGNKTNQEVKPIVLSKINDAENNFITQQKEQINTAPITKIVEEIQRVCPAFRKIFNAILSLLSTSIPQDREAILKCIEKLKEKLKITTEELFSIIQNMNKSFREIREIHPVDSRPVNIRNVGESFDECIEPTRAYLASIGMTEDFDMFIKQCERSFISYYNKENPSAMIDYKMFKQLYYNSNIFKKYFAEKLKQSQFYPQLVNRAKIFYNEPIQVINNSNFTSPLMNLPTKNRNEKQDNDTFDLDKQRGHGNINDENIQKTIDLIANIDELQTYASVIEHDIISGKYMKSNDEHIGGMLSSPHEVPNDDKLSEQISRELEQLHELLTTFTLYTQQASSIEKKIREIVEAHKSIIHILNQYICSLMSEKETNHILFVTSNDVTFALVTIRSMRNNKKFCAQYPEYIPAATLLYSVLSGWFPDVETLENDKVNESRIGMEVKKQLCEKKLEQYFDPDTESANVKFWVAVLAAFKRQMDEFLFYENQIVSIAVLNDYKDDPRSRTMYEIKSTKVASVVTAVSNESCKNLLNQSKLPEDLKKYSVNFTVATTCSTASFEPYIKPLFILKTQNICIPLTGYSGTGKTTVAYGLNRKERLLSKEHIEPGGIIYNILDMKGQYDGDMYISVLEVGGYMLPFYEAANMPNDKNGGFIRSISFIKKYTDCASFRNTGKYDSTQDTGDGYDYNNFEYFTDNAPGSLITDQSRIREYFANVNTKNYIENEMYLVKNKNISQFLSELSDNLIDPIDEKRRKLGSIRPTPNNIDSSRTSLIISTIFKINGEYRLVIIFDNPGAEHVTKTNVAESRGDIGSITESIREMYGERYTNDEIDAMTKRLVDRFPNMTTIMHLIALVPFVLFALSKLLNINFIQLLNELIARNRDRFPESVIAQVVKNVGDTTVIPQSANVAHELKLSDLFKKDVFIGSTFPQTLDWRAGEDVDNIEKVSLEGRTDLISLATLPHTDFKSYPNVLRYVYITTIIKHLLLCPLFSIADIVSVLLKSIHLTAMANNKTRQDKDAKRYYEFADWLGISGKADADFLTNKINTIFQGYFINELVGLTMRDVVASNTVINPEEYRELYQGSELQMNTLIPYILRRLYSYEYSSVPNKSTFRKWFGPPDAIKKAVGQIDNFDKHSPTDNPIYGYNPIAVYNMNEVDPNTEKKATAMPKIYYTLGLKEPNYMKDDEYVHMREKLQREIDASYNYSKLISEINNNKIYDIFNIGLNGANPEPRKVRTILLYVMSNVDSIVKCEKSSMLLENMRRQLDTISGGRNAIAA